MAARILEMAGPDWPVPDFSSLSRRQEPNAVEVSSRRATGPPNLPVPLGHCCATPCQAADSAGIKFPDDGEWPARTHGSYRQYRKVHLALHTATGGIRAVESASSREGDSPVRPERLGLIPDGQGTEP